MTPSSERRLTGWHVFAMFVAGFGVIIAVNLTLAVQAIATFPGLETRNSYVASQQFNAARATQDALGWTVLAGIEDGRLTVAVTDENGRPVRPAEISATLGRATHVGEDSTPGFAWTGEAMVAPTDVVPGYWNLRLVMQAADGTPFRRRIPLIVAEPGA